MKMKVNSKTVSAFFRIALICFVVRLAGMAISVTFVLLAYAPLVDALGEWGPRIFTNILGFLLEEFAWIWTAVVLIYRHLQKDTTDEEKLVYAPSLYDD